MKFNPEDMLIENCLYILTVYSKVNGEWHEVKFQVISRLCIVPLCDAFESYMIKKLKKDGTFDYYEELHVFVSDRKPL